MNRCRISLVLILQITIFTTTLVAASSYMAGDTLTIWAPSGLYLRPTANLEAIPILTMPFGGQVIALTSPNSPYNRDPINSSFIIFDNNTAEVTLMGSWLEVNYKGHVGYVFDAYLSTLPPPMQQPRSAFWNDTFSDGLEPYLRDQVGLLQIIPTATLGEKRSIFRNGIYLNTMATESTFEFKMVLPDYSLSEVFLLIYHFHRESIGFIEQRDENFIIHFGCGIYELNVIHGITIVSGGFGC